MPDYDTIGKETKVLISFGAIKGGMELVMQLVYDICNKYHKNPNVERRFVYLDAFSLGGLEGSSSSQITITDDNGTAFMSDFSKFANKEHWEKHFEFAMKYCKTMIFMVSEPWLKSPYCWQEFAMFKKWINAGVTIRPLLVVFADAQPHIDKDSWTDRDSNVIHPSELEAFLSKCAGFQRLNEATMVPIGNTVSLNLANGAGKGEYRYQYDYILSEGTYNALMSNIIIA